MKKNSNNLNKKNKIKKRIKITDTLVLLTVLIVLIIIFSILSDQFTSYNNIISLLKNIVVIGILAAGLTPLMIARGIDISFGSSVSLISVVIALIYNNGVPLWASILIGILLSSFIGFFNGFFIERFNLLPIIFTLGMMAILKSIAFVLSDSESIGIFSDGMFNFAFTIFLKIPKPLWVLIIIVLIFWILLRFSRVGIRIYAIGSNSDIADLFGIKVNKLRIILYTICGLTTGIATIVAISITGVGTPVQGLNLLLPTLSAVVLGGIALTGGAGNIFGTVLGVLIISVIFNGLTMLNFQSFYIKAIQGLALILVVSTYDIRRRRKSLSN